jgi:hypothetical protein
MLMYYLHMKWMERCPNVDLSFHNWNFILHGLLSDVEVCSEKWIFHNSVVPVLLLVCIVIESRCVPDFTCYKLPCIGPQSWPWIPTPCCCSWCYWCTVCKMAGQHQHNRGRMPGLLKIRVQCLFSFIFLCLKLTAILNQGFFTQKDYKMFPPTVDWDNIDWSTRRPQMDFPVQVLYIINSSMLICSA